MSVPLLATRIDVWSNNEICPGCKMEAHNKNSTDETLEILQTAIFNDRRDDWNMSVWKATHKTPLIGSIGK